MYALPYQSTEIDWPYSFYFCPASAYIQRTVRLFKFSVVCRNSFSNSLGIVFGSFSWNFSDSWFWNSSGCSLGYRYLCLSVLLKIITGASLVVQLVVHLEVPLTPIEVDLGSFPSSFRIYSRCVFYSPSRRKFFSRIVFPEGGVSPVVPVRVSPEVPIGVHQEVLVGVPSKIPVKFLRKFQQEFLRKLLQEFLWMFF